MYLKIILFFICSIAFMFLFNIGFNPKATKDKMEEKLKALQNTKRPQPAKEFIEYLAVKDRRNYLPKNKDAAFSVL